MLNVGTGKFYSNQELYFQTIFQNKCFKLVYLKRFGLELNNKKTQWKNISFVSSYLSLRLIHDMILPFSNNCDKKLIPLLENFGKIMAVPSISMYLLNHKSEILFEKNFEVILKDYGSSKLTYVCRKEVVSLRKISWKKNFNEI